MAAKTTDEHGGVGDGDDVPAKTAKGDKKKTGSTGSSSGRKRSPTANANNESEETALERRRRISRMSSKRLRDKVKNNMEDLQAKRTELLEKNDGLKIENASLRDRVAMLKSCLPNLQQQQQQHSQSTPVAAATGFGGLAGGLTSLSQAAASLGQASSGLGQGGGAAGASAPGINTRTTASTASSITHQRQLDELTLQLLAARQQQQLQLQASQPQNPWLSSLGFQGTSTAGLGSLPFPNPMFSGRGGTLNSFAFGQSNPLAGLLALQAAGQGGGGFSTMGMSGANHLSGLTGSSLSQGQLFQAPGTVSASAHGAYAELLRNQNNQNQNASTEGVGNDRKKES